MNSFRSRLCLTIGKRGCHCNTDRKDDSENDHFKDLLNFLEVIRPAGPAQSGSVPVDRSIVDLIFSCLYFPYSYLIFIGHNCLKLFKFHIISFDPCFTPVFVIRNNEMNIFRMVVIILYATWQGRNRYCIGPGFSFQTERFTDGSVSVT